jgi:hypothetical protein
MLLLLLLLLRALALPFETECRIEYFHNTKVVQFIGIIYYQATSITRTGTVLASSSTSSTVLVLLVQFYSGLTVTVSNSNTVTVIERAIAVQLY